MAKRSQGEGGRTFKGNGTGEEKQKGKNLDVDCIKGNESNAKMQPNCQRIRHADSGEPRSKDKQTRTGRR